MVVAIYSGKDSGNRFYRDDAVIVVERPRIGDQDRAEYWLIIVDRRVSRENVNTKNSIIRYERHTNTGLAHANDRLIVKHRRAIGDKPDAENALLIEDRCHVLPQYGRRPVSRPPVSRQPEQAHRWTAGASQAQWFRGQR